jgi:mRNA-degrading endonuclease YafQ of YafQ-DinJ toxin-antitoxin module
VGRGIWACVSTSDYLLVYNTILNVISAGSHAEGRASQY